MEKLIEKRTKALQNSVKYMRAFLDLQPSPVCIIDKKNCEIIDGSQKFLRQFGLISLKEFQSLFLNPKVVIDNSPEEYPEILVAKDWVQHLIINNSNIIRVDLDIDGKIHTFEISAHNMLYSSGVSDEDYEKHNYVVVILYDITILMAEMEKNKKQEEKLIQNSKMAQMGEMIGAIAHQWKQPLNIISLYTHEIGESAGDEKELYNISEEIYKQIEYMAETIDDFRKFFVPSKKAVVFNVLEAMDSVERLVAKHLKMNRIAISIDGDSTIFAKGYENEFKQAMINIINNAKDAIKENKSLNGFIKVTVEQKEELTSISIEDNGGGVPEKLLPTKIFTPYITTKGEKGTGIGLSMVKTILEKKLDGDIFVSNTEDGARFTITLPKVELE